LEYNLEHQRSGNSTLRKNLADQLKQYTFQINERRALLKTIIQNGSTVAVPAIRPNESGKVSDPTRPRLSSVTEAQSQRIADEMINTDLDLIKAQSILEVTEAASNAENDPHVRQALSDLRLNVAALLKQREYQVRYFEGLTVQKRIEHDSFEATLVSHQLELLMRREEQLTTHLKQLEFESNQENVRVEMLDPAIAPKAPTKNDQIKYMEAAPIAVLLALIGLALLTPVRGSRAWTAD
jgi:hypothetical protein